MRRRADASPRCEGGDTLIEVLVTLVILTFAVLGFVALQAKIAAADAEAFARTQAIVLLSDMTSRMTANASNAADYVASGIGTGDSEPTSCSSLAVGAARDLCEWSNELKGAAETKSSANVGAMPGALGCIEQVRAADPAAGVCTPAIYQVTVAWQGMTEIFSPALTCGQDRFGADDYRRAVASRVVVGLPGCI